jgi:hypothetical protein
MPYEYQENAIARIKSISEENPYQDDIPGLKKLPITSEGEDFDINKHFDQCIKNWGRHG